MKLTYAKPKKSAGSTPPAGGKPKPKLAFNVKSEAREPEKKSERAKKIDYAKRKKPALTFEERLAEARALRDGAINEGKKIEMFGKIKLDWEPSAEMRSNKHSQVFKEIMASATWAALTSEARDLYYFLRARWDGDNHSRITAPMSVLRAYGWRSAGTRARALAELDEAQLIEIKGKNETGTEVLKIPPYLLPRIRQS